MLKSLQLIALFPLLLTAKTYASKCDGFLLTPMVLTQVGAEHKSYPVHAINLNGEILKTWKIKGYPFYSILSPDGDVVVLKNKSTSKSALFLYYAHYRNIEVISKGGRKTHDVAKYLLHHDITVDKDGFYWALGYEELSSSDVKNLNLKTSEKGKKTKILANSIIKFDKQFNVVKKWLSKDFYLPKLSQEISKINLEPSRGNFNLAKYHGKLLYKLDHFNSIQIVNDSSFSNPQILISDRNFSRVFFLDQVTNKITWMSNKGQFTLQHDPQWLGKNKISVFDNGVIQSRVVIYDIKKNKENWVFDGSSSGAPIQAMQMASPAISGAETLADRSILVTEGIRGFIYRVSRSKQVLWRYFSPLRYGDNVSWPYYPIFKVRNYNFDGCETWAEAPQ